MYHQLMADMTSSSSVSKGLYSAWSHRATRKKLLQKRPFHRCAFSRNTSVKAGLILLYKVTHVWLKIINTITNEANQRVLVLPVASLQSHPSASLTFPGNNQTACLGLMKYISNRTKRMEHTSHNSVPSCINIRLQSRFSLRDQINSFSPHFHSFFFFGSFSFFFQKNRSS